VEFAAAELEGSAHAFGERDVVGDDDEGDAVFAVQA
jgi:hypothetical protein